MKNFAESVQKNRTLRSTSLETAAPNFYLPLSINFIWITCDSATRLRFSSMCFKTQFVTEFEKSKRIEIEKSVKDLRMLCNLLLLLMLL